MRRLPIIICLCFLTGCTAPLIESDGVMLINESPGHPAQLTKGRPSVLAYWSASCGECGAMLDELEELHMRLPQLAVVAINEGDDQLTAEQWWNARRYSFPSFIDPKGVLAQGQGIVTLPVLLFRDEFQATIFRLETDITRESIDAALTHMLVNQYMDLPAGSGS